MTAVAVSLVAVLGLGGAYAWFTATTNTEAVVRMGNLKISADFIKPKEVVYEPGNYYSSSGSIENVGSIDAVLHVTDNSQLHFEYADDNFSPWIGDEWVADTQGSVKSTLSGDTYGYGEDSDGNLQWAWFYDMNNPQDKYLLMAPGAKVDLSIDSLLDGDIMCNQYQDALVKISSAIHATQTFDGALLQEFGIVNADLDLYFGDIAGFSISRTRVQAAVPGYIMDQINAIFHR